MSRSETLDAFIRAREEDPDTRTELSPGELMAAARYHLDAILAMSAAGRSGDDDVIDHLEEAMMCIGQALVDYKKRCSKKPRKKET